MTQFRILAQAADRPFGAGKHGLFVLQLIRHYGVQGVPDSQSLRGMGWFRPSCKFSDNQDLVSIIILTFNQIEYTRQCIQSLFEYTSSPFELILVDNGSTDGTVDYLSALERSKTACIRLHLIVNKKNAGFAKGCNQGIAASRGDSLLLLNNDVVVTPGWLSRLTRVLTLRDRIGLVGPVTNYAPCPQRITDPLYDIKSPGGLNGYAGQLARRSKDQTLAHWRISGFCLLIKRAVIEKIGGMDTRFNIGNFEDDDFCLRARLAGFESLIARDCFVHHFGGKTFSGNHLSHESRMQQNWTLFKHKWRIASETPLGPDYRVPLPASGFSRRDHYIPIEEKKPGHGARMHTAPAPAAVRGAAEVDDDIPGGYKMSVLDQVCSIVQERISRENKPAAVWILDQLIACAPDHADAHHELGLLRFELGDLEKAHTHLQRSVALNPENPSYIKNLGDFFHVALKDTEKALSMYDKAAALSPGDRDTLLKAGHLHLSRQHFEQARQYYLQVLDLDPLNDEVRGFIDKIVSDGRPDHNRASVEQWYEQAQKWVQAGNTENAIATLDQLLAMEPQHALAHNDRGVLAFESGDKNGALSHYQRAVELEPDNKIFLKNLADFYLVEKSDARAAMEKYVEVLKRDPSDIETILSCGQVCMQLERNEDARDFFHRVLEIEPWNEDAQRLIGIIEAEKSGNRLCVDNVTLFRQAQKKAADGDIQGALAHLNQILEQDPQNAQTCNDLGVLYYENGEKEKALSCYEQAVQLNPHDTNFQKNLADFYLMEQGRLEDAMKIYVRVLEGNPQDIDSLLASGLVCASLGKTSDALSFFHRVLEIQPWNESAHQSIRQIDGHGHHGDAVGAGDDHQSMERKTGNSRW